MWLTTVSIYRLLRIKLRARIGRFSSVSIASRLYGRSG